MAGYTRQSTGQIINGSPITAPPLNSEFNQVAAAFNATTGHGHTGGVGDSPQIPLATSVSGYLPSANGGNGGKNNFAATSTPLVSNDNTQGYAPGSMWENTTTGRVYVCVGSSTGAAVWRELTTVISNNQITPATHNTVDLGTPSVRFQDLYLQGGISAVGNVTVGGALNSTSLTTTGTITVGSTIDINGGTIDGTVVGGSSAQAVTGTVVTATTNFAGDLVGNVTGNITGNSAGTHTGAVIGDVTGNITAASGTSSVNNLTVNGTLNMNAGTSATIENLSAPSNANDAARKADVDAVNAAKLNLAGGTMSGDIAMGSNTVSGLGAPSASTDAATKGYVDTSVSNLVDSAPGTLDTLNELAAALGDDPDFATTITNSIATKLPLAGGTMTGDIVLGANKATSTATPATDDTLTRKGYVDTQDALKLPKAGGTMSGAIAMGTNKITGLGDPTANQDASTKAYTDTQRDTRLPLAGGSMTGGITMGNNKVTATYTPSANIDLTNKSYVDGILGSATSAATSAASAATSATNAGTSATNSSNSAAAALVSQNAAAASLDSFDDRYLGAKSSAPSTDNDGNALLTGALYWNTSNNSLFIWTGSAWNAAAFDTSGALLATNNLSDLNNATTARTNLGFNAGVDAHLNTSTAANGEYLSWNGSDYDWEEVPAGSESSLSLTGSASAGDPMGLHSDGTTGKIGAVDVVLTSQTPKTVAAIDKHYIVNAFDSTSNRLVVAFGDANNVLRFSSATVSGTNITFGTGTFNPTIGNINSTLAYSTEHNMVSIGNDHFLVSLFDGTGSSSTFKFAVLKGNGSGTGGYMTQLGNSLNVTPTSTNQRPQYSQGKANLLAWSPDHNAGILLYTSYNSDTSSSNKAQTYAVAVTVDTSNTSNPLTIGTPVVVTDTNFSGASYANANPHGITYDTTANRFLIAFAQGIGNGNNDAWPAYRTATLSGTGNRTITFGSIYMPTHNAVDSSGSISYATGEQLTNNSRAALVYVPSVNRHVHLWQTNNLNLRPLMRILDVSGSNVTAPRTAMHNLFAVNQVTGWNHFGAGQTFANGQGYRQNDMPQYWSAMAAGTNGKLIMATHSGIEGDYGTGEQFQRRHILYPINVPASGSNLTLGSHLDPAVNNNADSVGSASQHGLVNIGADNFVFTYNDRVDDVIEAKHIEAATVNGPTPDKFIGIAKDGAGTVTTLGGTATGLSGLTTGSTYYVTSSGTVQTTDNGYPVGKALSATTLLLNRDIDGASYSDTSVNTHLNTSTAASGEFLSWNGSDYDWAAVDTATLMPKAGGTFTGDVSFSGTPAYYDLSKNVYQNTFYDPTQATGPKDVFFKTDGTKLYVICDGTEDVFQYSLSTAYDISTATYDNKSLDASSRDSIPYALHFKPDGTKLYILGLINRSIFQHTLTTAWDVSTASYDNVSLQVQASPTGMYFKSDGSAFFIQANGKIYRHTMSSAWDLSSASWDQTTSNLSYGDRSMEFVPDGTSLFTTDTNAGKLIEQFNLSTAWDLTSIVNSSSPTAVYTAGSGGFNVDNTEIGGLAFNSDGSQMIVAHPGSDYIHKYSFLTPAKINAAYSLPTADGAAGTALVTNGSGALSFASVGADLYAANESSPAAQPSATGGNAVAIGDSAVASAVDTIAIGFGATATGNFAASFGRGQAAGTNSVALGRGTTGSSASDSFAMGQATVTGSDSVALGTSRAGGAASFAAVITENSTSYGAQGANSIAMGYQNKATGSKSVAIGSSNQATNSFATAIGTGNYATHYNSVSIGRNNLAYAGSAVCMGTDNEVDQSKGFASGEKAKARTIGQFARSSGGQGTAGEMQTSWFTLNCRTTDATTKIMGAENGSNGTMSTDQVFLVDDSAMSFTGTIVACGPDGTKTGGWEIRGHLKNAAGTTTLPASSITELYNPEGWTVALTAHDAHNSLRISVTGEANLEVWWSAQIMSSEVVNN